MNDILANSPRRSALMSNTDYEKIEKMIKEAERLNTLSKNPKVFKLKFPKIKMKINDRFSSRSSKK